MKNIRNITVFSYVDHIVAIHTLYKVAFSKGFLMANEGFNVHQSRVVDDIADVMVYGDYFQSVSPVKVVG